MNIGTHDSVTGESGIWWAKIFTPFARTQSKTLIEQLNSGCTLFDIRIKKVNNVWRGAHGLWATKKPIWDLIYDLCMEAKRKNTIIRLMFTYEGKHKEEFINFVNNELFYFFKWNVVRIGPISVKYRKKGSEVKYDIIREPDAGWIGSPQEQCFLPLDGKTWHIPIPWLWKQFYFRKVEFNSAVYRVVDFL